MNKYEVEIDGTLYRVTIEEISESERSNTKAAEEKVAASQPAPAPAENPAPTASGSGEQVTSPMAGNVFKVLAQPGQQVEKGETVIILEAMKMENEIIAPDNGTISAVHVKEGQSVESNDVLFEL